MKEKHSVILRHVEIEIGKDDVLELVKCSGMVRWGMIKSYTVYVEVPGGGDWSGRTLEIDDDVHIHARLTVEYKKVGTFNE